MDLGLRGRMAFVSGSTQGIGYAVARELLAEGATVIVNGRSEERVAGTVRRLIADRPGADVSGIAADFADREQVEALVGRLADVDILVNNVGLFEVKPFVEIDDAIGSGTSR